MRGTFTWALTIAAVGLMAGGVAAQPGRVKPAKPDPAPLPLPGPTSPPATIPEPSNPPSAPPTTPAPQPTPSPTPAQPSTLTPSGPAQGGLIDLRPKFKVGQEFRLRMGNTSESTTTMPGLFEDPNGKPLPGGPTSPSPKGKPGKNEDESKSTTTQDFVLVFRPKSVAENGEATVDVVFESIKMKVESDWMTDEFDSTKPPKPASKQPADPLSEFAGTPPLEQALRPLVGETITLTVDSSGNVTKVEGGEKIAALFGQAGGGLPGSPNSGGGAKSLFGSIFTIDKTRPTARVGDTWTTRDTIDLSLTGPLEMSTTYSVMSARGGRATVGIKGSMQNATAAWTPGAPFKINAMTHEGSFVWNTEDGFVESMASTQKLDAELKLGGAAGKASSVQKTTVTRVR
jgi:hypothetical protein